MGKKELPISRSKHLMIECPPFSGQSLCSDEDCPCDNTSMPPALGYLWIKPEVAASRLNCLTMNELVTHLSISGISISDFEKIRGQYLPLVICKEAAIKRKLDLKTAEEDYNLWVKTSKVPCMSTPSSGGKRSGSNNEKGILTSNINEVSIRDFRNFLNLSNGDLKDKIYNYFGEPSSVDTDEKYDFDTVCYGEDDEINFSYYRNSGILMTTSIESISAENYMETIKFIEDCGINDVKTHFLGKHKDLILKQFGKPTSISSDNYEYSFDDFMVNFICYDTDNYLCSSITVQYFGNNDETFIETNKHSLNSNEVSIRDFKNFLNLSNSDSKDKILKYFGKPTSVDIDKKYEFDTMYYRDRGNLRFCYYRNSGIIMVIEIEASPVKDYSKTIKFIEDSGINDDKIHFLGKHRDVILAQFGKPTSSNSDNYEYSFSDFLVNFICYDMHNYLCSSIKVR